MLTCSTKKVCYREEEEALEALLDNRARNNYGRGAGPINIYRCDICGNFHFTSKGSPHPTLSSEKKRIDRSSEAYFWEQKLK